MYRFSKEYACTGKTFFIYAALLLVLFIGDSVLGEVHNAPYGTRPEGSAPSGSSPAGSAPSGTSPLSPSPDGTAPSGSAPYGTSPETEPEEHNITSTIFVPANSADFFGSGDIPYTEVDSLVVGSENSEEKPISHFDNTPIGVPYVSTKYTSEAAADSDSFYRSLGTPYTIRTDIQKKAESRGYF